MLTVNRLGEGAGRYYLDGDVVGRWCGRGRRDLGLDGVVEPAALTAVLRGRHPGDGIPLSTRRVTHRCAGWDLIFSAPKSVSLLTALAPPEAATRLRDANRRATADAFAWLEANGCWARRAGALVATSGFVAARYGHEVNAADEPHLHTHVLVANVVRAGDGRWSAVDGSGLWLNRRSLAAAYHLALRQQILAAGYRLSWDVHDDGTADVAEVPRAAIEATSSRRQQIRHDLAVRDEPSTAERTATQRRSRSTSSPSTGPGDSWAARANASDFGGAEAAEVIDRAARRHARLAAGDVADADPVRLATGVARWLAERRSAFGPGDVMQALAAHHADGATATAARRWADEWCAASPPTPDGRRTSVVARAADVELTERIRAGLGGGVGLAGPASARPLEPPSTATGAPGDPIGPRESSGAGAPPPAATSAAATAEHLVTSGHAVEILGGWPGAERSRSALVAQAEILDRARQAWQDAGHTVGVAAPSVRAQRRWRALAGLDAADPTEPLPSVLVVDRADRRPTPELRSLLDAAHGSGTKVVLVVGGTLPPRRRALSEGLEDAGDRLGRLRPGQEQLLRRPAGPDRAATSVDLDRFAVCPTGRSALDRTVATWARTAGPGPRPLMVALGPAECDELNQRARAHLRSAGVLHGPEVDVGGRPYAAGDEVVALRRGPVPAGTVGRVTTVEGDGHLQVRWAEGETTVDRWAGRYLGHAYATTPALARYRSEPIVALAEPSDLGPLRDRVALAVVVAPTGPWMARPGSDPSLGADRLGAGTVPTPSRIAALTRVLEAQPVAGGPGPAPSEPQARLAWRHAAARWAVAADRTPPRSPEAPGLHQPAPPPEPPGLHQPPGSPEGPVLHQPLPPPGLDESPPRRGRERARPSPARDHGRGLDL